MARQRQLAQRREWEGGTFAIPICGSIFLALIVVGLIQLITGTLSPVLAQTVPATGGGIQPLTLSLIPRAFASGCIAMPGVEAISNGNPAFQKLEK